MFHKEKESQSLFFIRIGRGVIAYIVFAWGEELSVQQDNAEHQQH